MAGIADLLREFNEKYSGGYSAPEPKPKPEPAAPKPQPLQPTTQPLKGPTTQPLKGAVAAGGSPGGSSGGAAATAARRQHAAAAAASAASAAASAASKTKPAAGPAAVPVAPPPQPTAKPPPAAAGPAAVPVPQPARPPAVHVTYQGAQLGPPPAAFQPQQAWGGGWAGGGYAGGWAGGGYAPQMYPGPMVQPAWPPQAQVAPPWQQQQAAFHQGWGAAAAPPPPPPVVGVASDMIAVSPLLGATSEGDMLRWVHSTLIGAASGRPEAAVSPVRLCLRRLQQPSVTMLHRSIALIMEVSSGWGALFIRASASVTLTQRRSAGETATVSVPAARIIPPGCAAETYFPSHVDCTDALGSASDWRLNSAAVQIFSAGAGVAASTERADATPLWGSTLLRAPDALQDWTVASVHGALARQEVGKDSAKVGLLPVNTPLTFRECRLVPGGARVHVSGHSEQDGGLVDGWVSLTTSTGGEIVVPNTSPPSETLAGVAPGSAAEPLEYRQDTDGRAYTKQDFIAQYGGTAQWDAARRLDAAVVRHMLAPAAGAAAPAPAAGATAAAPEAAGAAASADHGPLGCPPFPPGGEAPVDETGDGTAGLHLLRCVLTDTPAAEERAAGAAAAAAERREEAARARREREEEARAAKAGGGAKPAPARKSGEKKAAKGGGKELPPGWVAYTDPKTQKVFYHNKTNGKSSWSFPEPEEEPVVEEDPWVGAGMAVEWKLNVLKAQKRRDSQRKWEVQQLELRRVEKEREKEKQKEEALEKEREKTRKAEMELKEWAKQKQKQKEKEEEKDNGKKARENGNAAASADAPAKQQQPQQQQDTRPPPAGWRVLSLGEKRFYHNADTGQTQWRRPDGPPEEKEKRSAGAAGAAGTKPGGRPGELPPGWVAYTDTRSGKVFYHNQTTGKSSWTFPRAPSPPPAAAPAAADSGDEGDEPAPVDARLSVADIAALLDAQRSPSSPSVKRRRRSAAAGDGGGIDVAGVAAAVESPAGCLARAGEDKSSDAVRLLPHDTRMTILEARPESGRMRVVFPSPVDSGEEMEGWVSLVGKSGNPIVRAWDPVADAAGGAAVLVPMLGAVGVPLYLCGDGEMVRALVADP